jgi:hypothetical protein
LSVLVREAWLKRSALYVDGLSDVRSGDTSAICHWLLRAAARRTGILIVASNSPLPVSTPDVAAFIHVSLDAQDVISRARLWTQSLTALGAAPAEAEITELASRFRLTPEQITRAASHAASTALWCAATGDPDRHIKLSQLFAAARAQCGAELSRLTRKIEPRLKWPDVALPADQSAQLQEICDQARLRQRVLGDWGFDRKLSQGKGLAVLFAGPPGTGKTMAAELIAGELGLDLYRIDLAQVVSKYIGETEKNLDRIFAAAAGANAILFFDEADALFGKRSEVRDSHDRYANIEVGYLLQKMEEHDGIAILATNARQHLDAAFLRRLLSIVEFPFPDEPQRECIWQVAFPKEAPLAADVDFALLAREVRLCGGNIKNIALVASFHAAREGGVIEMRHIAHAARREHQKLGRSWDCARLATQGAHDDRRPE